MAVVTVVVVFYSNYRIWKWLESEPTIAYTVSAPKVAEDAKVLELPAVKVNAAVLLLHHARMADRWLH